MIPYNKVRLLVLLAAKDCDTNGEFNIPDSITTDEEVCELYDKLKEAEVNGEFEDQIREGEVETDIDAPYSRNYESKSVAAQLPDGSWIGWTYWYGGGKHGNPEEIDWMDDAYTLDCEETQQMVTVRKFTKAGSKKKAKA